MSSADYIALTPPQRQDVRASQRTFEGAYMRTALSKLAFGMLILRVFSREFLYIGIVFVVSAVLTVILSVVHGHYNEHQLIYHPSTTITTGGNFVFAQAVIDLSSFTALIVLLQLFK